MLTIAAHRFRALVLVFLFGVLAGSGCDKHARTKKEVQSGWETYRAAADSGDGATAAKMMSKNTIDMYTRLVKLAMDAPAAECWKLPPSEMAQIASMRNDYTRKDLRVLNGIGFVARAVKDGNWDTYDDDWKLRDIKINAAGDYATAVICNPKMESDYRSKKWVGSFSRTARRMNRGMEAPPTYPAAFFKDGDIWKYDETVSFAGLDKDITDAAKESRMSVRDFITVWVTDEDDAKAGLKIWDPMPK